DDVRCTPEQAEQVFVAMRERNPEVPVRMVLFPGENHDLTRTGRLRSQMRHLEELVAWFRRFLAEGGTDDGRDAG
ncbi:MAG: prolyl oligopeptidase family serine peptidase, partial [Clostridia bacterium]|nr:prolyl oligopeptidase family serine peptidase [Clostridia bacterium]